LYQIEARKPRKFPSNVKKDYKNLEKLLLPGYTILRMNKIRSHIYTSLGILTFLVYFSCGNMDSSLLSSNSYRVTAIIGGPSLEERTVVGGKDSIQPAFLNSVLNDPDLRGLAVYIQSSQGRRVSGTIRYRLKGEASPQTPQEETVEAANPAELEEEDSAVPAEIGEGEAPVETEESAKSPAALPAEAAADTPALPTKSGIRQLGPEGEYIMEVKRLDRDIPAFTLPAGLEPGVYTLVFEMLGEEGVLSRINRPFYYLGNAAFDFEEDLHSYLPGITGEKHLIPPGTQVLLEARIGSGAGLKPYVIWYNGKVKIGEGAVQGDNARLLWQVGDRVLFHTIKAEIFPFPPEGNRGLLGLTKTLRLPVSAESYWVEPFPGSLAGLSRRYALGGSLTDEIDPERQERALVPGGPPRWLPLGNGRTYGLVLGKNDSYGLELSPATEEAPLGVEILLRLVPVEAGLIFRVPFSSSSLWLQLSWTGEELLLELSDGDTTLRSRMEDAGELPLKISLDIGRGGITAALTVGEQRGEALSLDLSEPISPSFRFTFGGTAPVPESAGTTDPKAAISVKTGNSDIAAVLDEVVFRFIP
jgi:hypothetical protein